jgi:6-phospho-beta-glucosidase
MKVAVIGGGSTYTPELLNGFIARAASFPLRELLTVEAAVSGDRRAAYQALLAHPLGPASDQAQAVLDDLLETHQAHLPQFFT